MTIKLSGPNKAGNYTLYRPMTGQGIICSFQELLLIRDLIGKRELPNELSQYHPTRSDAVAERRRPRLPLFDD